MEKRVGAKMKGGGGGTEVKMVKRSGTERRRGTKMKKKRTAQVKRSKRAKVKMEKRRGIMTADMKELLTQSILLER